MNMRLIITDESKSQRRFMAQNITKANRAHIVHIVGIIEVLCATVFFNPQNQRNRVFTLYSIHRWYNCYRVSGLQFAISGHSNANIVLDRCIL